MHSQCVEVVAQMGGESWGAYQHYVTTENVHGTCASCVPLDLVDR